VLSKQANFFFFISNLAEWHPSFRKEYNHKWLETTGAMTKKESESIQSLIPILKKYGFRKDGLYLGNLFYGPRNGNLRKKIQNKISLLEKEVITRTLETLKPRFESIWKNEIKFDRTKPLQELLRREQYRHFGNDIKLFFSGKTCTP
jgi:hypothetical protein